MSFGLVDPTLQRSRSGIRIGRSSEAYQLQCHACGTRIEILTYQDHCLRCGERLIIHWKEGRRQIEQMCSGVKETSLPEPSVDSSHMPNTAVQD